MDAMTSSVQHGMNAGFFRYITKPIDVRAFLAAIDAAPPIATVGPAPTSAAPAAPAPLASA